jgi:hypothetical protein
VFLESSFSGEEVFINEIYSEMFARLDERIQFSDASISFHLSRLSDVYW